MSALALALALLAVVAVFILSALVAQLRAQVALLEDDAHTHEDIGGPDSAGEETSSPAQTDQAARVSGDFAAGAALAACIEHLGVDVDSITGVRVTPTPVAGWADVTVDHDVDHGDQCTPATLRRWLPVGTAARGAAAEAELRRSYRAAAVDHDQYGSYRRRDLPAPADPSRPYARSVRDALTELNARLDHTAVNGPDRALRAAVLKRDGDTCPVRAGEETSSPVAPARPRGRGATHLGLVDENAWWASCDPTDHGPRLLTLRIGADVVPLDDEPGRVTDGGRDRALEDDAERDARSHGQDEWRCGPVPLEQHGLGTAAVSGAHRVGDDLPGAVVVDGDLSPVVHEGGHETSPSVGRPASSHADVVGVRALVTPGASDPTVGGPTDSPPVPLPGVVSVDGPVGGGAPPASPSTVALGEGRERISGATREELMTGVLIALDLLDDTVTVHQQRAIRRALLDPIVHPERYAL